MGRSESASRPSDQSGTFLTATARACQATEVAEVRHTADESSPASARSQHEIAERCRRFETVAARLADACAGDCQSLVASLVLLQRALACDAHGAFEQRRRAELAALAERNERLARLTVRDPLTGLPNRRALMSCLRAEHVRAVRDDRPFSLLFVDLDRFKEINDRLGHRAGDRVLRRAARTMVSLLRPGDIVGRYGGEEFVVGLVDADEASARHAAERLRVCIANLGGPTASIGVASRRGSDTIRDLIERADAAMYTAKKTGRDRVVVDTDLVDEETARPAVR